jgi:hypothetical protein
VAPGGNPDADRFRPLRCGRSTSSLTNALLIHKNIAPSFPLAFQISHSECQIACSRILSEFTGDPGVRREPGIRQNSRSMIANLSQL